MSHGDEERFIKGLRVNQTEISDCASWERDPQHCVSVKLFFFFLLSFLLHLGLVNG